MPVQLSLMLDGLQAAGRDLEKAARRIAAGNAEPAGTAGTAAPDSVRISAQGADPPTDYAVELVNVLRARTAFKADLRALSAALDVEESTVEITRPHGI